MKDLKNILKGIDIAKTTGPENGQVSMITFDSRQVRADALFLAVKGTQSDGHQFIPQAIKNGAIAIMCEDLPLKLDEGITYYTVPDSAEALGIAAGNYFGNPSEKLKLLGITGTNGKTTIATLLYELFIKLGYATGLMSTIRNLVNGTILNATHTTPDAIALNQTLYEMVSAGCEFCFMEVSSHAVAQKRIAGLKFSGGIFTNITHDHLDYHSTFKDYLQAKKQFFDGLPSTAFALTNIDDKNGKVMLQNTKAVDKTYSLKGLADFRCRIIENQFEGLQLQIDGHELFCRLVGAFNAYNILAVYATAVLLGQEAEDVLRLISQLETAEGRFDCITSTDYIIGIVDYAHTPDALKNVLQTINQIRSGNEKLITVVGAGGDRDRSKRPLMAEIAASFSDQLILTSDNPRSEDPESIIKDMQAGIGLENYRKVLSITDRKEAIKTACAFAQSNDIILVAGKGHEKYQEIKGKRYPFDDKEILRDHLVNQDKKL